MAKPNVLVLTGYGINCDEETQFAFERAGARADIVHLNEAGQRQMKQLGALIKTRKFRVNLIH